MAAKTCPTCGAVLGVTRHADVRGERNPAAKLSAEDAGAIRRLYDLGETAAGLGRRFGVSEGAVRRIVKGRGWK